MKEKTFSSTCKKNSILGTYGKNKIFITILVLSFLASDIKSTSYTWTNAGGNNLWNNAANWSPNGVPNNATVDDVTFNSTSSANCTIDISPSVSTFIVSASYAGVISLGSNTISWYNSFTVTTASQFNAGTGLVKVIGGNASDPTFNTAASLYNVELACVNSFSWVKLNNDVTITNNLTITSVSQAIWGGHTFLVGGNFTNNNSWLDGGVNIKLNGTGTQIFSSSIAIPIPLQIGKCSGTVTFNNNPPSIIVVSGYWDLNGQSITASGGFSTTGGYIIGTGILNGAVTCTTGGLAPGNSTACITINGNLTLSSGSNFSIDINGNTACTNYDEILVNGTVTINGATLIGNTITAPGGTITILENNLADAIAGTKFSSAPEGATVNLCGASYTISYVGGSGNDITLTWIQNYTVSEINVIDSIFNITDGSSCILYTTDFSNQSVCTGTIVRTYSIENLGTATLNVTAISVSGGNSADFTVGGLSLPTTIAVSSSKTFTITFNPSALGLRSTTVNITNDDCDENPYNFNIQGTGVDPEINLQGNAISIVDGDITPSLTDFTDFDKASTDGGTVVRTFTIQNTGTSTLNVTAITFTGTHASDFTFNTGSLSLPASIAVSASATFTVTFDPTALGVRNATIHIANNDCNESDYDFAIKGTGIAQPAVTSISGGNNFVFNNESFTVGYEFSTNQIITVSDLGFYDQNADGLVTSHPVGLFNICEQLLTSGTVPSGTGGTLQGEFRYTSVTPVVLEPGTYRIGAVVYNGGGNDAFRQAVTTVSTDPTFSYVLGYERHGSTLGFPNEAATMTGLQEKCCFGPNMLFYEEGTPPGAPEINLKGNGQNIVDGDASPSSNDDTDFGNADPSGGTVVHTYTVENTGTSNLVVSSITKTGANQADFIIGSLSPASPVPAGSSATFTITFDPGGSGNRTATIHVNNNDCNEPDYDFAVQGNGCVAPFITACPSDLSSNTTAGICTKVMTYTVTASGTPTPTYSYEFTNATIASGSGTGSGSSFNKGVTNVIVTASNGCGTDATCSFTVTITDNENPVISCPANITITTNSDPACSYLQSGSSLDPVSYTDNCPGSTIINNFSNSNTLNAALLPNGSTVISWTVTDASSNSTSCSFTATVHGTIYNMTQDMYFCTIDEAIASSETEDNDELMIPAGTYSGCIHVTKTIILVPSGTVILNCLNMEEVMNDGTMTLMDDITINTLTLSNGKIHTNGHHLKCGTIAGGDVDSYIITD